MDATVTARIALVAGLVVLLLVDLFVLHRGTHVISMHDAAWSTADRLRLRRAAVVERCADAARRRPA